MYLNIFSTFDGLSALRVALDRLRIKPETYIASEIDKFAIQVTQYNYPDTIQLGDIQKISSKDLPKINLLVGGSPCQGFSSAGKGLNFNDPRSKLFFEFERLMEELNPEYFLLENVQMKKEWEDIISSFVGVKPIIINSNLVSAQNRVRVYWTNIPNVKQPEDRKLTLPDIFDWHDLTKWEQGLVYSEHDIKKEEYIKIDRKGKLKNYQDKSSCICGGNKGDGNHSDMDLIVAKDGVRRYSPIECERLQTLPDNYTAFGDNNGKTVNISNSQRYKMLGNAFTVDVIAHILENIKVSEDPCFESSEETESEKCESIKVYS